jgi:EAL domain-containing protein (putative c-di-GMP-specific phosphodiesterase class I)
VDTLGPGARGPEQPVLVEAILQIGRTLRLCTVAEGIEHAVQQRRLLTLGCDRGQGYYFAAPARATEIEAFLRHR